MNWFKRMVVGWVKDDWENSRVDVPIATTAISKSSRIDSPRSGKMNFSVYKAQGGHVVEFNSYDDIKDQHSHALHIINDTEDFSESLGKIVFMEVLKR